MENPKKVKSIMTCATVCIAIVQLFLAIFSLSVFVKSQGNVQDTISTWELVRR